MLATAFATTPIKTSTIEGLLASRRDTRCAAGPISGLDQSGCSVRPTPDVLELGSCTACTIAPHGWNAAVAAIDLLRARGAQALAARIRRAIADHYKVPAETAIAFAPSGTSAMYVLSALARARWGQPWRTVLVGRGELGSAVPLAARGRHFSALAPFASVGPGTSAMPEPLAVDAVRVRDPAGALLPAEDVSAQIERLVCEPGVRTPVLLHVVEHGETGVRAPDDEFLCALEDSMPELAVSVDATQGRVGRSTVQRHLARGRAVLVTGSKFAGGPAFCGALLLPPSWIAQPSIDTEGLECYSTRADLPWPTRQLEPHNVGLLVRWYVACAELSRFASLLAREQDAALGAFGREVRDMAARYELRLVPPPPPGRGDAPVEGSPTVFCIETLTGAAEAHARWLDLLQVRDGRGFHLGRPHEIGVGRWVLRLACSAPLAVELASGRAAHLRSDLDRLGARLAERC